MDNHHDEVTEIDTDASQRTPLENKQSSKRIERGENRRRGNPLIALMLLILGVLLGVLATLSYILFLVHDRTPVKTASITQASSLSVQVTNAYLTHLVSNSLKTSGVPGTMSNVQVTLANNNMMTITGTDKVDVLFFNTTQPFSVTMQVYTQSCQPKVKILRADLGSIPVTNFVQSYENEINQEIQQKPTDLPAGFVYCATSMHTQSDALTILYSATPD